MLVTAVAFPTVALAIHILFVVGAFGIVIGYPVILLSAERLDRRAMPVLHRVRVNLGRSLVNPGLLVVVIAGVYLASHLHQWSHFYVQWGIAAAVVIGGLEGSFVIPQEKRMAELAARDIEAAGDGEVSGAATMSRRGTGRVSSDGRWRCSSRRRGGDDGSIIAQPRRAQLRRSGPVQSGCRYRSFGGCPIVPHGCPDPRCSPACSRPSRSASPFRMRPQRAPRRSSATAGTP